MDLIGITIFGGVNIQPPPPPTPLTTYLWAWGHNQYGKLGLGDTTNRSSPTQLGAETNWSKVSAGSEHGLAIKPNGTLWSWGRNNDGRLGLNNTTYISSPVQIGALTTWSSIAAGNSSMAISN